MTYDSFNDLKKEFLIPMHKSMLKNGQIVTYLNIYDPKINSQ